MSQCKFLKNDITFMQETHIIGNHTVIFDDTELKGWTFINSGMKAKASAGVGKALSQDVKIVDINNILDGIKISAFCAYAPTELYADCSKQGFFSTLQKSIQTTKTEHPGFKIIIGADNNATIGYD